MSQAAITAVERTAFPSITRDEEVEFWRVYRDAGGAEKREYVTGLHFGPTFPDFAAFLDTSRRQPRWIIIHRNSGKAMGECMDLQRIPLYLEAINGLLNWSAIDSLRRDSFVFHQVLNAAKRFGIENL